MNNHSNTCYAFVRNIKFKNISKYVIKLILNLLLLLEKNSNCVYSSMDTFAM